MPKLLPMLDPLEEIKRLYFSTTRQTIERDMARALELLRMMASDEARERAAGYMHGLSDLQREWKKGKPRRLREKSVEGREITTTKARPVRHSAERVGGRHEGTKKSERD